MNQQDQAAANSDDEKPRNEKFRFGSATHVGMKRSQNQDSLGTKVDLGLFLVADGMGGHRGGEIASADAVETISKHVRGSLKISGSREPRKALMDAIIAANDAIYKHSAEDSSLHGMGTTTTAILFHGDRLYIGHVGDSRCYFLKKTTEGPLIWQATRDHSLVQEKLRAGLITRAEVQTDSMKNVITRSVGFEPVVHPEIYELHTQPGDVFLVCSDGLSGMMEDTKILSIIQREVFEGQSPQKAADRLIATANANGGTDNVTVVVVEVIS